MDKAKGHCNILQNNYLQTDEKYHIKSSVSTVIKFNMEIGKMRQFRNKIDFFLKKRNYGLESVYTLDDVQSVIDSNDLCLSSHLTNFVFVPTEIVTNPQMNY